MPICSQNTFRTTFFLMLDLISMFKGLWTWHKYPIFSKQYIVGLAYCPSQDFYTELSAQIPFAHSQERVPEELKE